MVGLQLFLSWNSHTKGCLSCFIWDLSVDTGPEGRFLSFKSTSSNDRVLYVYAPQSIVPGNSWTGGHFSEGLQNYTENKDKGNENKILEDFNCTMDKMDRDGENKTQRLCWCCSSYALSKLIVDNELADLWRRDNTDQIPLSSPATIGPLAKIQDRQGPY